MLISLSDPNVLKYKFNDSDVNYITSSFMIDKLSITWTQRDQGHYMFNMELSPACFLTYCPGERLALPGKVITALSWCRSLFHLQHRSGWGRPTDITTAIRTSPTTHAKILSCLFLVFMPGESKHESNHTASGRESESSACCISSPLA
jgi:hypothetical protein